MHDQIGSNNESDVIPFARGAKSTTDVMISSTQRAAQFWIWCKEPLALLRKTAGTPWKWRRSSRISCGQPKIGLQSSKRRSRLTRKGPTERSSGSIVSTPRLKIDFSDRVMTAAAHRNGRSAQIGANN